MRYCLVSAHHWKDETEKPDDKLVISGLYQWGQAFGGGDYLYLPDLHKSEIEQYDIIHVNMTINNQTIITELRDKIGYPSNLNIVANVDVSPDMWQSAYGRLPLVLLRELDKADLVFHVEPKGASILASVLSRPVPIIPHPVDIDAIRARYFSLARRPDLTVIYHRYDGQGNWLMPYLASRDLDIKRVLIGWSGDVADSPLLLYNDVLDRLEFDDLLPIIATSSICCDPFTMYSYGRFPIECAALGVPCITSDRVAAGRLLYPDISVDPFDVYAMRSAIIRLSSDIDFYEHCSELAFQEAHFYNLEQSKLRLLANIQLHTPRLTGATTPISTPIPPWSFPGVVDVLATPTTGADSLILDANDKAMSWCLSHGYQSCYTVNGQVFLPPLSDLSELVLARVTAPPPALDGTILELGCFQAVFLLHLAHRGFTHLMGFDPSLSAITRAKANLARMQPHLAAGTHLALFNTASLSSVPSGLCATTLAIEVLEHCIDPASVLAELVRVTDPQGQIIITVPDRNRIPSPYHINYFSLEGDPQLPFALSDRTFDLSAFLSASGCSFQVELTGPYFICTLRPGAPERGSHGDT